MLFQNEDNTDLEREEEGNIEPDSPRDTGEERDENRDAEARAKGWVPKDEYRGRPEDWQDSDSFLTRNSALQSSVRELEERLASRDEEYAERIRRIEAANERIIRADREKVYRELEDAKRQAVELADAETYDRIRERERAYYSQMAQDEREEREQAAPRREQAPPLWPETQDWIRRNSWFNESEPMRQIAIGFYREANEGMPARADENKRLAYVEKQMARVYPDKFGGHKGSSVETGGRGNGNSAPIHKLTNAERDACRKFIKMGVIKDEAEYISYLNE